jgi:hypothetical protein
MDSRISILFDQKENDKDALLRRDILLWYSRSIITNNPINEFRFSELGKWLIENNLHFSEEFSKSNIPKSYRLTHKRTYITNRLNELVLIGLVKIKRLEPSKKNKSLETEVYTFGTESHLISIFLNAWYSIEQDKQNSIERFLKELCNELNRFPSSLTNCLIDCFTRFVKEGNPKNLNNKFLELFLPLFPLENNSFRLIRLTLLNILYNNKIASEIFVNVLDKLDNTTKELVLLQFKLDIESSYYDGIGTTKEWEIRRYNNINNPNKVVLQQYCLDCKNSRSFIMNTTELIDPKNFIPQDLEVDLYAVFRMGCNNCNNRYARLIIPVWCRPRSFFHQD